MALLTGDRLLVAPGPVDSSTVTAMPAERDGPAVGFETTEEDGQLYVVPTDAAGLVADGVLDRELFNVTKLIEFEYDAAHGIPTIVTHDDGAGPAARTAATPGALSTHPLPSIAGAAVTVDAAEGRWWSSVRAATAAAEASPAGDRAAAAGPLDGVSRVWLDELATLDLHDSVPQIGAPEAWDAGLDGTGAAVAVVDSGIDTTHPDLAGKVIGEANFTTDPDAADGIGHGTHVAATVAGSGAADGGYVGVAPGADLLNAKVCTADGCPNSAVIAGMEWAAAQGADVVNMSLGCTPSRGCAYNDGTDPMSQAVNQLTEQHDTLFVSSAGNDGADRSVGRPAVADAALAVGAITKIDELAGLSSRGPRHGDLAIKPEIAAPGVGIVAARADGTSPGSPVGDWHTSLNGTSMASPHVAGAAAIVAQRRPEWGAEQLKAALVGSAADLDIPAFAQGAGRVDLPAAVDQQLSADPTTVSFGRIEEGTGTRTVSIRNPASSAVELELTTELTGPGETAGVVTVSPETVSVPANASVEVTLTMDADLAADGEFSGRLVAHDSDGQRAVAVPIAALTAPQRTLTVDVIGFDGEPHNAGVSIQVFPVDRDGPTLSAGNAGSSTDFEVLPGAYQVEVDDREITDPDRERSAVLVVEPELTVAEDTRFVVDFRELAHLEVDVPEPTLTTTVTVGHHRTSEAGNASLRNFVYSNGDRIYVRPGDQTVDFGTFQFRFAPALVRSQLDLSVGDLTVHPRYHDYSGGFDKLALQRFEGTHHLELRDLGAGTEEDFASTDVVDKLVLLELPTHGSGSELVAAIDRAVAAEAAGVVYFDEAIHTRHVGSGGDQIPVLHIGPEEGLRLRAELSGGAAAVRLNGFPDSPFGYHLHYQEEGRVVPDATLSARPGELAARDTSYHADTESWMRQAHLVTDAGFELPEFLPVFVSSFRAPTERVDYYGPVGEDRHWVRQVFPSETDVAFSWTARDGFTEADRVPESWNAAPVRPAQPAPGTPEDPSLYLASRQGNTLWTAAQLLDGQGRDHLGGARRAMLPGPKVSWRLTRDGDEVPGYSGPSGMPLFDLPPEPAEYELQLAAEPGIDQAWSETVWRFESQEVAEEQVADGHLCGGDLWAADPTPCQPESLLQVDYEMQVDTTNTSRSRAGQQVVLRGYHAPGAADPEITQMSAWVARDGGDDWREVPVRRRGDGSYLAMVPNQPRPDTEDSSVSLRVSAMDAAGAEVTQTLHHAYTLPAGGDGCDETVTGSRRGALVADDGVTCLAPEAEVSGPVIVLAGAELVAVGASINGPVTASGAAGVQVVGSRLTGPVSVVNSTGEVVLASSELDGPVSVVNNDSSGAPIVVSDNDIAGPLRCHRNQPVPADLGLPNASGPVTGQCTAG